MRMILNGGQAVKIRKHYQYFDKRAEAKLTLKDGKQEQKVRAGAYQ